MSISKVIQDRYAEANQQLIDAKRWRALSMLFDNDEAQKIVAAQARDLPEPDSAASFAECTDHVIRVLEANGYVI